jgi:hypothetical protein
MTLPELHALLDRRGVKLSARGDRLHWQAPAGAMTAEIVAALQAEKPRLLATLARADDRPRPAGPPGRTAGSDDPGSPSAPAANPPGVAPPHVPCKGVVGLVDPRDIGPDGKWSADRFFARLRAKHGYDGGQQPPPKAAETTRRPDRRDDPRGRLLWDSDSGEGAP